MNTYVYRYISDYLQGAHELATVREVYVYTHVHINTYKYRIFFRILAKMCQSPVLENGVRGPWEWGSWSMRMGFVTYTHVYMQKCVRTLARRVRVRSMRMGFVIQRWKVRNPPPYTEAERKYTEAERKYTEVAVRGTTVYSLHPWKPVRKFDDSRFQVFTGVPITE